MKYTNTFKNIVSNFTLKEDDNIESDNTTASIPSSKKNSWKALSANTDFEGNHISDKYKPVYVAKYGDDDFELVKNLIPNVSVFNDDELFDALKTGAATYSQNTIETQEQDVTDTMNELQTKAAAKKPIEQVKHKKDDLAVNKKDKSNFIVPDSEVIHKNAVIDTKEMLMLAKNGIYPEFVYHKPKIHLRWINDEGEKTISTLYGISEITDGNGENYIIVRDILPPTRVSGQFWKRNESESYLLPAEKVRKIIEDPLNTDIVDNLFRVNKEENDPQAWVKNISDAKEVMDNQFENWKAKYWLEYDLDKYTEDSLRDIFLATAVHTHGFPIKFAIRKYGELKNEKAEKSFKREFDTWYKAFGPKYKLDRFDDDTVLSIYAAVKNNKMNIEDAILQYGFSEEDEVIGDDVTDVNDVTESVLAERRNAGEVDDKSKEWMIKDPNILRDLLNKLGIDPTYVSNPIKVTYPKIYTQNGKETEYGEKDKRYVLAGVKRPNLYTLYKDEDPSNFKTFYLKDLEEPSARPVPISYKALRRMLNAPENEDPTPDMWEKASTWKNQQRSLNRGTNYKQVDIADEVIEAALTDLQTPTDLRYNSDYDGYDLVKMYYDSKKYKKADPIVTHALRKFFKGESILVHPNYDNFKNYRYIQDLDTKAPIRARYTGSVAQGPYRHLLMSFK